MQYLSDKLLVEAYMKAVALKFDADFIKLLEDELLLRGFSLEDVLK
ncbi:sporulation histidine kinase inhibitor Sda [Aquibacillus salsiterrae]|uniref:Sporulation histidine kinase inhibitor Sda n=1 Tax=Aquibacillus salsiterrae TaxID=2950439 RepID=A0A9X3WK22_9BACI|nr:sporulation histidine kinase inhibitor Sda [Aquibacillus salsiterrae]MDC3418516.1 sporulation histidine kinase inhibitor Sda [Aquibacillus salsiterrae]